MKRAATFVLVLALAAACSTKANEPLLDASTSTQPSPAAATSSTVPSNVGTATSSGNEEHPPPDDVTLGECNGTGQFGPTATGTLTNHSSKLSNYMISVNFTDDSGTIVAQALGMASNIPPGSTATWEAESFDTDVTATNCSIVKVDRYSAE